MSFVGTNGVDTLSGTQDRPFVFGFGGNDTFALVQTAVVANGYLVSIFGGADQDTISNTNFLSANSRAFIDGGGGDDMITGTPLNDGFRDSSGNDTIDGGNGTDTAYLPYLFGLGGVHRFTASGSPTNLSLSGANGNDTYSGVELFQFANGTTLTAAEVLLVGTVGADELPGDSSTTGTISSLQPRFGRVGGTAGDQDWYTASLLAGVQYTVLLYGVSLEDPLLRLLNSAGGLIAENDDGGFSGGNLNSLLTYTPAANTNVFLSAGGIGTSNGRYELAIFANQTGTPLFNAGNNNVGLTSGTYSWDALAGDDVVTGSAFADRVVGGVGFDGLYGGGGNDFLHGGANEDIVAGDAGDDVLEGGDGGDVLSELAAGANSGNDLLYGGNGVDIMYAADGNDFVYGGSDGANNYANLGAGNDAFWGANGTDVVVGGDDADDIRGNGGHDSLYGEASNDGIYGGAGIDLLSGADGNDVLFGGDDNDLLVGDAGNDVLDGGTGTDVLYGGDGDDILRGGSGSALNALYGGTGNDTFQVGAVFGGGADYIYDFQAGDRIVFQTGHFSQIAAGSPDGTELMQNYTYSGGNSTVAIYDISAAPGGAVTATLVGAVVVVGVDIGALAAGTFDINGIF